MYLPTLWNVIVPIYLKLWTESQEKIIYINLQKTFEKNKKNKYNRKKNILQPFINT